MNEEYITLEELYLYNSKLFKKNLKSFYRTFNVPDDCKEAGFMAVKKSWVEMVIPTFNCECEEINPKEKYFEVKTTLEKYGCKKFNPIGLNLDSTHVKYFNVCGKRTPFFTPKGMIKIMVLYNDISNNLYEWVYELFYGRLKPQIDNLNNIVEMANVVDIPIFKKDYDKITQIHLFDLDDSTIGNEIVLDFKRLGDFKKEEREVERYKCPLHLYLQKQYAKKLKEVEDKFNFEIKEIKQEKVIKQLQQELDKEKCLKELTQSFIPKQIISPQVEQINGIVKPNILKPSKIK